MSSFLSIIWDVDPEVLPFLDVKILGNIRWYGILWALSFIAAHFIMDRAYRVIGRDKEELDALFMYTLIGCIAGARIGHCLFYGPYWNTYDDFGNTIVHGYLSEPWTILYVWEGGLASHGAGIGLLLACFFFYKKFNTPSYIWVIDRVAITIALAGCFIRFGNYMNSEIIGKPTDTPFAVTFAYDTRAMLESDRYYGDAVTSIEYNDAEGSYDLDGVQLEAKNMVITFKKGTITKAKKANVFDYVDKYNSDYPDSRDFILLKEDQVIQKKNTYSKKVYLVARHPSQLYESISSLVIFLIMIFLYFKVYKGKTPDGLLIGIFMIGVFTLRFFYEFSKESQVLERDEWALNTGQWLSIPMVTFGILCVLFSLRNKDKVA